MSDERDNHNELNRGTISLTVFVTLIGAFSFLLSSIKNHVYVISDSGVSKVEFWTFVTVRFPEFLGTYGADAALSALPIMLFCYMYIREILTWQGRVGKVVLLSTMACLVSLVVAHAMGSNVGEAIVSTVLGGNCYLGFEAHWPIGQDYRGKLIYPFWVLVFLVMHHFLCFASTEYSFVALFLPLLFFVVSMVLRALYARLFVGGAGWWGLPLVYVLAALTLAGVIAFSAREYWYQSLGDRKWRQTYYIVLFSAYFAILLIPRLSMAANVARGDADMRGMWVKDVRLCEAMLVTIPLLCGFSVHGLLLYLVGPIPLVAHYYAICISPTPDRLERLSLYNLGTFILVLATFVVMSADPILYFDPRASVFSIPSIVSGALAFVSIVLPSLLDEGDEHVIRKIRNAFDTRRESGSGMTFAQRSNMRAMALCFLVAWFFAAWYDIGMEQRANEGVAYAAPILAEGIWGYNSKTWASSAAFLIAILILALLLGTLVRKDYDKEKTETMGRLRPDVIGGGSEK